jgi:hypothetical protein
MPQTSGSRRHTFASRVRHLVPAPSHLSAPSPRPAITVAIGVVVALLVAVAVPGVGADSRDQRDQVREQRAALVGQIDVLEASDDEIRQALRDLDEHVRAQQAALADAERAAADAERRADEAGATADAWATLAAGLRDHLAALAVEHYVNPPGEELFERFQAATATEAAEKRALLGSRASATTDVIDLMQLARYEAEEQRRLAREAKERADEQRRAAVAALDDLNAARARQQAFADELEVKLNARLAEAAALASIDADLSRQILAEQAALAEELRRSAPPAAAAGAAAQPTTPAAPAPPGSSPPAQGPTAPPSPTPPPPPPPPVSSPSVPLRTVRGITVHADIAGSLDAMLGAASAAGIVLGGSGYRDPSAQVALRRAHCGTSTYAIYEMPPSQCRPPTAIPGTSMHERGLAIDFTVNGSAITSRDSVGFRWLAANAARYGFYNLPSEPWHWSVNGS